MKHRSPELFIRVRAENGYIAPYTAGIMKLLQYAPDRPVDSEMHDREGREQFDIVLTDNEIWLPRKFAVGQQRVGLPFLRDHRNGCGVLLAVIANDAESIAALEHNFGCNEAHQAAEAWASAPWMRGTVVQGVIELSDRLVQFTRVKGQKDAEFYGAGRTFIAVVNNAARVSYAAQNIPSQENEWNTVL
jgi:hypothetical protein